MDHRGDHRLDEIRRRLAGVPDPAALLEGLFAFSPVGLQIYTVDGHSLLTNAAFRAIFGSEPPPEYCVFQDEVAAKLGLDSLIRRAFAGETIQFPPFWYDPRKLEHVHVTVGRRAAVSGTAFPLRDSGGKLTHVALAFEDITAEMLASERADLLARASMALSESLDYRANLAKIAELAVPDLADWCTVAMLDEDGAFRRVAARHWDPDKQALVDEYLQRFPPDQHRAGEHGTVLASGKSVLLAEIPAGLIGASAQSPDHERIMRGLGVTSCIMVPMVIRGVTSGVISFMMSGERRYGRGEQKLAEELAGRAALAVDNARLYESERRARAEAEAQRARMESLFLQAPAPITLTRGPDHVFELVHPIAKRMMYGREVIGRPIRAALPELDGQGFFERLDHVYATGEAFLGKEILIGLLQPDGTLRDAYFDLTYQAWRDADKQIAGVLTFAVDVTEQVAARRRVEDALRAREEFLSIASHELKTPLTALKLQTGSLGRTLARHGGGDPAIDQATLKLSTIDRQIGRLSDLIDNLLDVSRALAGRIDLRVEPTDFGEVVRDAAGRFKEQIEAAGCPLVLQVEECRGEWDPMRLEQITANLLSNAVKYGPGKPIEVTLRAADAQAILTVRDHGIGIPARDQERIFERFERAVSDRHYGGLGLGLWIARQIVRSFGGEIDVSSQPGAGALFTVTLPRAVLQHEVQHA